MCLSLAMHNKKFSCPIETSVVEGAPVYDDSLTKASVPASAYGFPDRTVMHFACQIQVCNKQEGECVGLTVSPRN